MLKNRDVNHHVDFNMLRRSNTIVGRRGDVCALNRELSGGILRELLHHEVHDVLSSEHVGKIVFRLETDFTLYFTNGKVFFLDQIYRSLDRKFRDTVRSRKIIHKSNFNISLNLITNAVDYSL